MRRSTYRDVIIVFVAIIIIVFMFFTGVGEAHEPDDLEDWRQDWITQARQAVTVELLDEWADMVTRHPDFFISDEDRLYERSEVSGPWTPSRTDWGPAVEQWRPLVAGHFQPDDVPTAMCLLNAESEGNPTAKNPKSTASGLFQLLQFWHDHYEIDPFIPEQNVWAAARIYYDEGGWTHWSPYNRGECR